MHFETSALLANLNPRAEYHGDEKEFAFDISLTDAELPGDIMRSLLGLQAGDAAFDAFFWNEDKARSARFMDLAPIKSKAALDSHRLVVIQGLRDQAFPIPNCKLHKFAFVPKDGKVVKTSFTVSVSDGDRETFGELLESISELVNIRVEAMQTEMELAS